MVGSRLQVPRHAASDRQSAGGRIAGEGEGNRSRGGGTAFEYAGAKGGYGPGGGIAGVEHESRSDQRLSRGHARGVGRRSLFARSRVDRRGLPRGSRGRARIAGRRRSRHFAKMARYMLQGPLRTYFREGNFSANASKTENRRPASVRARSNLPGIRGSNRANPPDDCNGPTEAGSSASRRTRTRRPVGREPQQRPRGVAGARDRRT